MADALVFESAGRVELDAYGNGSRPSRIFAQGLATAPHQSLPLCQSFPETKIARCLLS